MHTNQISSTVFQVSGHIMFIQQQKNHLQYYSGESPEMF